MATKLIFVSKSNMETAKAMGIGQPEQYVLIHSGIPIAKIRERGVKTPKAESTRVIATIGAFKPQKNLQDFLFVAKELITSAPNLSFLIIGDGELRPELEALRHDLGLDESIKMPGWRHDIPELLAIADVFVLTSLWEGLPRALLEAMVLGIPSVCYRTDGVEDVLDARSGTIVEQGDKAGMVKAIQKILNDPALGSALSAHAQQKIGTEFDIDFMVRSQETLYESLLSSHA